MTQIDSGNLKTSQLSLYKTEATLEAKMKPKTLLEKSRETANPNCRDIFSMIQYSIDEQRRTSSMAKSIIMFKKKKKPVEIITDYKETPFLDPDDIPVEINLSGFNEDLMSMGSHRLLIDDI